MRQWRIDWVLIFLSIAAVLIGVVSLYSGGVQGEGFAVRKLVFLVPSLIIMMVLAFFNYQKLSAFAPIIYAVGIFFLLVTMIPFIGAKINGARSWIRIFGIGFQPAEFMKLALIIALARYLVLRETEIGRIREIFLPAAITIVPVFLIALQPDLGGAMILVIILFTMLFIGGANQSVLFGGAIIGFFSLFIPLYIEYERYIRVYDITEALRETHFRLADALRILRFEVWHYLENPDVAQKVAEENSLQSWAIKTLLSPENQQIFYATSEEVRKQNFNPLRDFFSSRIAMSVTILVSLIVYGLSTLSRFFWRQNRLKPLATASLIFALAMSSGMFVSTAVHFKPHQVVRIVSFANPDKFPQGAGYQLRHSLITLGSGKFSGKGLFKGDMTKGEVPFLPEWHNDFIYSVIGEQFGFIGSILTLLILFGIVIRGIYIALQSKDDFGGILAAGISMLFFTQIVINIGITIGVMPVTGIPLVFISHGNSNMLVSFAALGILLNISRRRFINA